MVAGNGGVCSVSGQGTIFSREMTTRGGDSSHAVSTTQGVTSLGQLAQERCRTTYVVRTDEANTQADTNMPT